MKQMSRGEKVCGFIEKHCLAPEGDLIGQPIRLQPFQRKFLLDIYDNPYGTHTAYLSLGRKNGKTSLIACLLLAHLGRTGSGATARS
jgi:phage terminase large subunit-like protein